VPWKNGKDRIRKGQKRNMVNWTGHLVSIQAHMGWTNEESANEVKYNSCVELQLQKSEKMVKLISIVSNNHFRL
jgi:hypothetical protein